MDPCNEQTIPPEGTVDKVIPFLEEWIPTKEEIPAFSNLTTFKMNVNINWKI